MFRQPGFNLNYIFIYLFFVISTTYLDEVEKNQR